VTTTPTSASDHEPSEAPLPAHPPTPPVRRTTHFGTIALAGVAFVVVAALAFPRHPSGTDDGSSQTEPLEQPGEPATAGPQPIARPAGPIAVPVDAAAVAPHVVIAPSKKTLVSKPERNRAAESRKARAPIAAVTTVTNVPFTEDTVAKLPGSEPIAPPAPAPASTGIGGTAPVTITGCLEISTNQDEFRLTDTEGVDAPKSRGWRTGFLKKRPAPVVLVDPPDPLALQTHVGRRVAATGVLTSRDLKVSALRVVGPRCD